MILLNREIGFLEANFLVLWGILEKSSRDLYSQIPSFYKNEETEAGRKEFVKVSKWETDQD